LTTFSFFFIITHTTTPMIIPTTTTPATIPMIIPKLPPEAVSSATVDTVVVVSSVVDSVVVTVVVTVTVAGGNVTVTNSVSSLFPDCTATGSATFNLPKPGTSNAGGSSETNSGVSAIFCFVLSTSDGLRFSTIVVIIYDIDNLRPVVSNILDTILVIITVTLAEDDKPNFSRIIVANSSANTSSCAGDNTSANANVIFISTT